MNIITICVIIFSMLPKLRDAHLCIWECPRNLFTSGICNNDFIKNALQLHQVFKDVNHVPYISANFKYHSEQKQLIPVTNTIRTNKLQYPHQNINVFCKINSQNYVENLKNPDLVEVAEYRNYRRIFDNIKHQNYVNYNVFYTDNYFKRLNMAHVRDNPCYLRRHWEDMERKLVDEVYHLNMTVQNMRRKVSRTLTKDFSNSEYIYKSIFFALTFVTLAVFLVAVQYDHIILENYFRITKNRSQSMEFANQVITDHIYSVNQFKTKLKLLFELVKTPFHKRYGKDEIVRHLETIIDEIKNSQIMTIEILQVFTPQYIREFAEFIFNDPNLNGNLYLLDVNMIVNHAAWKFSNQVIRLKEEEEED